MEDFMWVIAAAFLVLIAMFFVSFIPQIGIPVADDIVEVTEIQVGAVGRIAEQPGRTIPLGSFNVGETQTELLKTVPQMRVYTGMSGSEVKEYEIEVKQSFDDLLKDITISFDVSQSNMYGDLVIKWNGQTFFKTKASPRGYVITIPKSSIRSSNNIEIYAEGPGLAFWAANTYIIREFNIVLNYGPSKIFSFQLNHDELETWLKARVNFYAIGSSGKSTSKLKIKVNGDEVYSAKPEGAGVAEFGYSEAPIKLGDNIVTFVAQDDTIIMQDTKLTLFLSTTELIKQFNFNLFDNEYNIMSTGKYKPRLRFYVEGIASGGTLEVGVNGNRRLMQTTSVGPNTVYIAPGDLNKGSNTLEFSGTGSWYIGRALVELEKIIDE